MKTEAQKPAVAYGTPDNRVFHTQCFHKASNDAFIAGDSRLILETIYLEGFPVKHLPSCTCTWCKNALIP